jgi:hypothetical protein
MIFCFDEFLGNIEILIWIAVGNTPVLGFAHRAGG